MEWILENVDADLGSSILDQKNYWPTGSWNGGLELSPIVPAEASHGTQPPGSSE
jgi:hypothetical protein